jgi:hypothetical protein
MSVTSSHHSAEGERAKGTVRGNFQGRGISQQLGLKYLKSTAVQLRERDNIRDKQDNVTGFFFRIITTFFVPRKFFNGRDAEGC